MIVQAALPVVMRATAVIITLMIMIRQAVRHHRQVHLGTLVVQVMTVVRAVHQAVHVIKEC